MRLQENSQKYADKKMQELLGTLVSLRARADGESVP